MNRYNALLIEATTNRNHQLYGYENWTTNERNRKVDEFINSRKCFENDVRSDIVEGKHKYQKCMMSSHLATIVNHGVYIPHSN